MTQTLIIFGSNGGNAEYIANKIAKELGKTETEVINASKAKSIHLSKYKNLILGCCTWSNGTVQYDLEQWIKTRTNNEINGKKIALFTTADQCEYPQTFADALGYLYNHIRLLGGDIIGSTSTENYQFRTSKAIHNDRFLGLVIDEVNQGHLTSHRIKKWVNELKSHFNE